MNEALELRPCPFCGVARDLMVEHMPGTILRPAYRVLCDNCGASTGYTDRGDHIAAWNTRSEADALRARLAELEAALEIIAGRRQCMDNLMGNRDVAIWALERNGTGTRT